MKVYKNPWVSRESYFVRTGAASSGKMEPSKSTGFSADFWNGKWKVCKATYYDKDIAKMPVVAQSKESMDSVIEQAVLYAILYLVRKEN